MINNKNFHPLISRGGQTKRVPAPAMTTKT